MVNIALGICGVLFLVAGKSGRHRSGNLQEGAELVRGDSDIEVSHGALNLQVWPNHAFFVLGICDLEPEVDMVNELKLLLTVTAVVEVGGKPNVSDAGRELHRNL